MRRSNDNEELCLQEIKISLGDSLADIENSQNTSVCTLQHTSLAETEDCLRSIDKVCTKADDQTEFSMNNGKGRVRPRVFIAITMMVSGAVLPVLYYFHEPSVLPALPAGAIPVLFPALAATVSVPVDAGKEYTPHPYFPAKHTEPAAETEIITDSIGPTMPTAVVTIKALPPVTGTSMEQDSELLEPGTDNMTRKPDVYTSQFPRPVPGQSASAAVITIHHNNTGDRLSAMTDVAYAAYVAGRFQDARQGYLAILKEKHNHREALQGVAASALRGGDSDQAWWMYRRLLAEYPHDPLATAGLINLSKGRDLEADTFMLEKLLHEQPQTAYLHFSLGSLYAHAGRWPEARAAFARAARLEGNNPDYACNLAITMDQLGDVEHARSYYGKALELSRYRQPYFDPKEIRSRLAFLTDRVSDHMR